MNGMTQNEETAFPRLVRAGADYEKVRQAIAYLSNHGPDVADLAAFASALDMTPRQLTALFRRWCGLTPTSFARAVALDHARRLLSQKASVLDTTLEVGLSSTSRLHDLFVTHEAMPPGIWARRGEGLQMTWGVVPSPFGQAIIFATPYGVAGLGFVENGDIRAAYDDLTGRWPAARFRQDQGAILPLAARIFEPEKWQADQPVRVVLIGTDFEVRVWETLLKIPFGTAATYGKLAETVNRPRAARAVGAAVGRNPISFVVPCHRVVGASGKLTGYHWGMARKRAILGWEAGISRS